MRLFFILSLIAIILLLRYYVTKTFSDLNENMTNKFINDCYNYALKNSAIGGKIVGAGGGGFLLFYSETPSKLRKALEKTSLKEVRFKFDFEGVKQILWQNLMQ